MRGQIAARCAESSHVAAEDESVSGLDLPCAGDDAEQRRLADAVGPDEPDHAAGRKLERDAVERDRRAVTSA